MICWPWGTYLGADALNKGVDVCVSSWHRPAPNTFPTLAKAGGQYLNAQLMKMEAVTNGYAEAIALNTEGKVSEGSGQNVFLVRDGTLVTPRVDGAMLPGITRDCVLILARDIGIPVRLEDVPREALYIADELFFTGTAAEISPIRSVDRIPIGRGEPGPIARRLQKELLGLARGEREDPYGWLTAVTPHEAGERESRQAEVPG
jgi:branched-chain amino acid aminotransferase